MNLESFRERIRDAAHRRQALRFRGGGSKDFYGFELRGEVLETCGYTGIVEYEPSELVITARCGTPLRDVESALEAQGQCLPFEPPHFGAATVGGCLAAGLSGPRRQSAGALRDFVLGTTIIDGQGELLRFGGKVMKNVAGYDVSRLMSGSFGSLGLVAEVSFKVLPLPPAEQSLLQECSGVEALRMLNEWGGQALPITATAWHENRLMVRLGGAAAAVEAATKRLGGERLEAANANRFWSALREQAYCFFQEPSPLWRLSVPSTTPHLEIPGQQLFEWGGGLRWLKTAEPADAIRAAVMKFRGHATLFRADRKDPGCFMPLDPVALRIHRELKRSFDPAGIFNPGRLYAGL